MNLKLKTLAVFGTLAVTLWLMTLFLEPAPQPEQKDVAENVDIIVETGDGMLPLSGDNANQENVTSSPALDIPTDRPLFGVTPTKSETDSPSTPAITPLRAISQDEALIAALEGGDKGRDVLQSFMDATAGDEKALSKRAGDLLEALGQHPLAQQDLILLQDAAQRIIEAAAKSSASAYLVPFTKHDKFSVPSTVEHAWDLGPKSKKPYTGFSRLSPTDGLLQGTNMQPIEKEKNSHLLSLFLLHNLH